MGAYLTVLYVLNFHFMYMTLYSAVFISISRTIMIYFPMRGNEMVKRLLPLFFFTIYILPILTTWFIYPAKCYMRTGSFPGFGASIDYVKVFPKWKNSGCLTIVASVCSSIFLLSSLSTLCRMRSIANSTGKRDDNIARAERSLTIMTFSIFVCIITLAATNVYFFYMSDVNLSLTLRPFQQDLLMFTPTWALFLTHPTTNTKAMFLPGNIHNNETIREMFHIVFTQYTYSFIVFTVYGIPTLLVLIRVVLTILNPVHKNYFKAPFFVLFTHDCLMNFVIFLYDYVVYRLPISGLISGWMTSLPMGPYLTVLYVLCYQFLYMTLYSSVFISISRTIVVYSPIRGNEVVKRLLPLFFLTIYFLPILTTWFLYPATCYMRIGSFPGFGASIDYVKVFPKWKNSGCLTVVASVCSIIFLLSSLATLCRMRSIANNSSTGKKNDNIAKAERSLTITTFSIFVCIITQAATNVYFLYVSDVNLSLTLRPFQQDLVMFTPIWVLFLTHPVFKRTPTLPASRSNTHQGILIVMSDNK
ncbi:hypothetical protein Y032_0198g1626 [Ancylostoma ceylanicum]|nr:hypothetical protein Y032_0198g1626 [Ancylostoma ceylanicum]